MRYKERMNNKTQKTVALCASIFSFLAILLFFVMGDNDSPAQASPQAPQAETLTTGWQKRCVDKDQKQCEIFQSIRIGTKDKNMRLSEVAISLQSNNVIMLGVTLPLGITLPQGLGLQVDEGNMMQMPFQNCNTNGCSAISKITSDILSEMKNGGILNVFFFDGANKKIKVELSLVGFTKAVQSL